MNLKRTPLWAAGLGCALIIAGSPLACGGSSDPSDNGGDAGAPGDDDETGGKAGGGKGGGSSSSGGKSGSTGGSENPGGDTGSGGDAPGSGGSVNGGASIDALVQKLCEVEFGCCDEDELSYRLGTVGNSVESCVDYFKFQLHESNATSNPFPSATRGGLLEVLGFTVDLANVKENPAGIAACVAQFDSYECPTKSDTTPTYCAKTFIPSDNPCLLTNLFKPALKEGERCTLALAEAGTNDVECEAGTTCLAPGDDNPADFPICVQRGIDDEPCTSDSDCDYNFYCDEDGKCAQKGDVGDDCSFKDNEAPTPTEIDAGCLPGLSCQPETKKCVANCTKDYPCTSNLECPKDHVCAPTTVGDDSSTWHTCQPVGEDAEARCDVLEDTDCASNRYCDDKNCQKDIPSTSTETCTRDAMCETGSFCDKAYADQTGTYRYPTFTCTANFQAGEPCYPDAANSNGCSSKAKYCLYNTEDATYQCSAALRKAGEDCLADSECAVGLACELIDEADTNMKCTAGAAKDDDCDSDTSDAENLDCGAGLSCVEGKCEAKLPPGADCEKDGAADPSKCLNGDCKENWNENGPTFVCSDAPVPESEKGDGLTCGK